MSVKVEVYKFQTDATGTRVLLYNENKSVHYETEDPEFVKRITTHLDVEGPLQKRYAYAGIDKNGMLVISHQVPDEDW